MNEPYIPDNKWIKCPGCNKIIYKDDFKENLNVCPSCNKHVRLSARERIELVVDKNSFVEMFDTLEAKNFLECPGYDKKLEESKTKSELKDAVVTGICKINKNKCMIAVMDSNFMMGSMGSVVGEKITRLIEEATSKKLPIIIFSASGGARMQEGIISLMQMTKISSALKIHSDKGLLYISVLTDPTTGGVTASFAMLGDINISEPKTLIGFAGLRVIKGTINQKLPEGFQTAEFVRDCGFLDMVVQRRDMKNTLGNILEAHKSVRRKK